jgi:hypothetical protein
MLDDWRFLLTATFEHFWILAAYWLTSLFCICYIIANVCFMTDQELSYINKRDAKSLVQKGTLKAKLILCEIVNFKYGIPDQTMAHLRCERKLFIELIFCVFPHIVLKQIIMFNSGETVTLCQMVSVSKSISLLFFGLG